jgi:hypothetical protein
MQDNSPANQEFNIRAANLEEETRVSMEESTYEVKKREKG